MTYPDLDCAALVDPATPSLGNEMDEYQQAVRSTETAFAAFRYALERLEKAKDAGHELEEAAHAARAHEQGVLARLRVSVA